MGLSPPDPTDRFDRFDESVIVNPDDDFRVDIDGFEGPLDLLLELARRQKVDLAQISILALTDQYLAFIEKAQRIRLDLAGDYLIMAAWLAYLKSRLILAALDKTEEPEAAMLAENLARQLQNLNAIRAAAAQLMERPRLGRDFAFGGAPADLHTTKSNSFQGNLADLLHAYAGARKKPAKAKFSMRVRTVWSLPEARKKLERLIGDLASFTNWASLDDYLNSFAPTSELRRTIKASTFAASLEMVREGLIDISQDGPFSPLSFRRSERSLSNKE